MKFRKINLHDMNYKKIKKEYYKFIESPFKLKADAHRSGSGIIYTLYSDKSHLIEVGFAENESILNSKLYTNELILLEKKKGKEKQFNLLINTLNEIGFKYSKDCYFKYSNYLMQHLAILGWPVGQLLYKERKIKKELSCA